MEELEKHVENLQILIQKATEKTILKRKASSKKLKRRKFSKLLYIPNKKELKDYQSSPIQIETMREKM